MYYSTINFIVAWTCLKYKGKYQENTKQYEVENRRKSNFSFDSIFIIQEIGTVSTHSAVDKGLC